MKELIIIPILLVTMLISSCSNEGDNPDYENEIAVFAYLYVDEPLSAATILVTKTVPLNDLYQIEDAIIDAEVRLNDSVLRQQFEFFTMTNKAGYYTINDTTRIRPQTTYELTILAEGRTITAQTTTPAKLDLIASPPESPTQIRYDDLPDHPFIFRCLSGDQMIYLEARCEEYWEDARYVETIFDSGKPEEEDDYEEDRQDSRFLRVKDLTKADSGVDIYEVDWYSRMIEFYGEQKLSLVSIDQNYHNYLYKNNSDLKGGIIDGIGVFGSADRYQYLIDVVK